MPCVVVGVKPIPTVITFDPVVTFWISRYLRLALVTALVAKAVLAVVGVPKRVVSEPEGIAPTVTVPEMAGREPMVTELPTVTVPEIGRLLAPFNDVPPIFCRPTFK